MLKLPPSKKNVTPDFIPLLDVIFVLLVFFLYASVLLKPVEILNLKLPSLDKKNSSNFSRSLKTLNIYLTQNGDIFIANRKYTLKQLLSFNFKLYKEIEITADKNTTYKTLLQLLDVLGNKKIHNISFVYITNKKEK